MDLRPFNFRLLSFIITNMLQPLKDNFNYFIVLLLLIPFMVFIDKKLSFENRYFLNNNKKPTLNLYYTKKMIHLEEENTIVFSAETEKNKSPQQLTLNNKNMIYNRKKEVIGVLGSGIINYSNSIAITSNLNKADYIIVNNTNIDRVNTPIGPLDARLFLGKISLNIIKNSWIKTPNSTVHIGILILMFIASFFTSLYSYRSSIPIIFFMSVSLWSLLSLVIFQLNGYWLPILGPLVYNCCGFILGSLSNNKKGKVI